MTKQIVFCFLLKAVGYDYTKRLYHKILEISKLTQHSSTDLYVGQYHDGNKLT